ncbi:MAG: HEAT repeat domain-containing protein, partial [Planctomycetota bacterium]
MQSDELKPSKVIGTLSRHAGVFVGTTAAIGKKITGTGISGLTAAKNLLTRTVGRPALVTVNDFGVASEAFTPEPIHSEMTARADMQGSAVTALESDLASARRELEKTLSEAEAIQSQLASQLKVLQAEKESLICELDGMRNEANEAKDRESAVRARVAALESDLATAQRELEQICRPRERKNSKVSSDVGTTRTGAQSTLPNLSRGRDTVAVSEEKVESSMKATAARPEEEATTRIEEQLSKVSVEEAEASGPEEVTLEEVGAAVFSSSAESVIFPKAFSDISNPDAAVRIDSVRAIGSIRHKLSVRVLVEQIGRESSARVRQECIKALTNLDAKEGLGVVERALSDRAALVRLAAVWGLYRLAGTESATALARMCSDE